MKIEKGCVYRAHCFEEGGVRINDKGHYHFRILEIDRDYNSENKDHLDLRKNKPWPKIYLGLKLDVKYAATGEDSWLSDAYWFNQDGVYETRGPSEGYFLSFKLIRKINKQ